MTSRKNLVILVADYPYGMGEPFLEDEIKMLEQRFDKIYFLNTNPNNPVSGKFQLYVPEKSKIVLLYPSPEKLSKFGKLGQVMSFRVMYELLLAVFKHKAKLSIPLMKLISYYWVSSKVGKNAIKRFVQEEGLELKETLFYSYWCDFHAVSLARMRAKNKNVNFITRLHGWDLYFERHKINYLPLREYIFNHAEKIIPISNDGRKYILQRKLSIHPDKVITSRLGADDFSLNKRYADQAISPVVSKSLTILTLSHINIVKRLDRMVEALKEIKDFEIVWHHIGYGYEPYETEFIQYANQELSGLANVQYHFHGQLTKEEVKHFLENEPIDVIVNCSDNEGIPVSLMEAISAGIPAIAFDIGGIPGIVSNRENGILMKFESGEHVLKLKNALEEFYRLTEAEKFSYSAAAKMHWKTFFNKTTNYANFASLIQEGKNHVNSSLSCVQCLINSDVYPNIVLDKYGVCDVCHVVEEKNRKLQERRDTNYLNNLLKEIAESKGKKQYDCILGISGGVDSAYLALKAREWGLNPLLVHIDNGWNSETAVYNIQTLINQLGLELYTVVIDWEEIKDLVRSFLKASVIDIDWANEMCSQAALYKVARKFGVKHILTGHQMATEGWMPDNVVHYKLDTVNFKAIHNRFGSRKLKSYKMIGFLKTYYMERILGIKYYYPLDYIDYNKDKVKAELVEKHGWRDYGQKHFESIFTRFYQGHILIHKFKIDKRKFHYSASILSGQLTKEKAIELLASNEYEMSGQMEQDKEYIIKKLDFTPQEFEDILNAPPKSHSDYPSVINIIKKLKRIKNVLQNNR